MRLVRLPGMCAGLSEDTNSSVCIDVIPARIHTKIFKIWKNNRNIFESLRA